MVSGNALSQEQKEEILKKIPTTLIAEIARQEDKNSYTISKFLRERYEERRKRLIQEGINYTEADLIAYKEVYEGGGFENFKINDLHINPKYEQLLPLLSTEEFKILEKSILESGVVYPIIINKDRIVLDGHQRLKICKLHFITDIKVAEQTFKNELEEKEFVILINLNRRHLTQAQKAELGLKILEIETDKAKSRQGTRTDLDNITPNSEGSGEAIEIAAKKVGLGKDTLWRVKEIKEVAQEDKAIAEKWELAKKGSTTINAIYTAMVDTSKSPLQQKQNNKIEEILIEIENTITNLNSSNINNSRDLLNGCIKKLRKLI